MKKIINKMRLQPPEMRVMIAVIAAIVVTGSIAFLWARTLVVQSNRESKKEKAEGPFTSLITNIKDVVKTSSEENPYPLDKNKENNNNSVQIIDDGTSNSNKKFEFDESNPADTSATSTQ